MSLRSSTVKEAADKICAIAKGTAVSAEFLGDILYEKPQTQKYYSKIDSLKKELEERKIFLDNIKGNGYRIVELNNSYVFVDGCIKKKKDLLKKQYKKIEHIPIAEMEEKPRNEAIEGIQKHMAIALMLKMGGK